MKNNRIFRKNIYDIVGIFVLLRSEVLIVVKLSTLVFWVVMSCGKSTYAVNFKTHNKVY